MAKRNHAQKGGKAKGKKNKKSQKPKKQQQDAAAAPEDNNNSPNVNTMVNKIVEAVSVESSSSSSTGIEGLDSSMNLFTEEQKVLALKLVSEGQGHLFEHWKSDDSSDDMHKLRFMAQLEKLDRGYKDGGVAGYLRNARVLLEKSAKGENPLEGWVPSVPTGESLELGTSKYDEFERIGLKEVGKCGFVLVAGGLGERLGYNGIKLALPTEMCTETLYLQLYIETILSIQSKYADGKTLLPLCIMVSNDTGDKTVELLEKNSYFGMKKEQITLVHQGDGVPAIENNNAKIALDSKDPYQVQAKPHGHGDVHALLYSQQVATKWLQQGIKWLIFCQDTNGLAFHTLPAVLGVSKKLDLVMNSVATPRTAKQAIGAITKLVNSKSKQERTINVEYNQLDPLLRATGHDDGDVNDPVTGFSPYPGNINQLVFSLKPYTETLIRTNGLMPEFVNPKYKDETKTTFKKPTRLECMMQDFPQVLSGEFASKVGFTSMANDICFSPVKNALDDGVNLQSKGSPAGVAATGEADQYNAFVSILKTIGCDVGSAEAKTYSGISVIPGPQIVLKPSFAAFPCECKAKFTNPKAVKISPNSSLVISGSGNVTIESLDLDGALVIECPDGVVGVVKDLVVKNKGWEKVPCDNEAAEIIRMRGYNIVKHETESFVVTTSTTKKSENEVAVVNNEMNNSEDTSPAVAMSEDETPIKETIKAATTSVSSSAVKKEIPAVDTANTSPASMSPIADDLSSPSSHEEIEKTNKCGCVIS